MNVEIERFILGPLENNTYLLSDQENRIAVVIDPSAPSKDLAETILDRGLTLQAILATHAHFDHIGGVKWLRSKMKTEASVALHKDDLELWNIGGGAKEFGFDLDSGDQPNLILSGEESLTFGGVDIKVLHTPGHTRGHVTYYLPSNASAFCGDLIFYHGVGRTDLHGGNQRKLVESIQKRIFTLPGDTRLLPGHGIETSLEEEVKNNPFL